MSLILDGTNGLSDVDGTAGTPAIRGSDANTGIFFPAADTIAFAEGGVESMRLDSNGNVGIGTSSPVSLVEMSNANAIATRLTITNTANAAAGSGINFIVRNGGSTVGNATIRTDNADNLAFFNLGGERMRIDSSGNLLVGTTGITISGYAAGKTQINTASNTQGIVIDNINGGSGFVGVITRPSSTSTYDATRFMNSSSSVVGSISVTTTATSYVTSSDYRLKHDIQPMTGALAKVALLKPVTYKWNADDSDGEGFIAHELQEVCPSAVTGEKDAVDADGKPVYQGIDTSFLVATLTAAIQELKAINDAQAQTIESLTARVVALEGA